MRAPAAKPRYDAPALDKGLDILEALAASPAPLALSELAAQLGRSRNELFRMLECLVRRGYVLRDADTGRSTLSIRLHRLAHAHTPVSLLVRHAAEPMRRFALETGESCHLSVLADGGLCVAHCAESASPVRLFIKAGAVFDPGLTASGRLLLSGLGGEGRAAVLAESASWRALKPAARAAFGRALERTRAAGIERAADETVAGVRDAALPATPAGFSPPAALAISVLSRQVGDAAFRRLEARLRRAAAEIRESL